MNPKPTRTFGHRAMLLSRIDVGGHYETSFKVGSHNIWRIVLAMAQTQIVSACSRPLATLVDQLASATDTQSDSSRAGAARLPTHRPPSSNTPHSVEVASAPILKQISCEPQVAHQLAAEIVRAFKPNLTDQQAGPLQASSSDSFSHRFLFIRSFSTAIRLTASHRHGG